MRQPVGQLKRKFYRPRGTSQVTVPLFCANRFPLFKCPQCSVWLEQNRREVVAVKRGGDAALGGFQVFV